MSNRLTFSLASLILIFALAFVAMPAMAATGGPTPTITQYSGAEDPNTAPGATNAPHKQERDDFRLLVTFDVLVASDLAESELTVSVAEAIGKVAETTTTSGIGTIVAITRGANAGKSFMVPVDLTATTSTSHTADAYSFGYISFFVNADAVLGNQAGHSTNGVGNVRSATFELTSELPKNNDWTFTPTLGDTADGYLVGGKLKTTKTFDVKFTAGGGTGAVPVLPAAQIQLRDKDGELIDTTGGSITAASPVPVGLVTTVTYTVGSADVDTPVTVGVNPNWAAGSTLRIPPARPSGPPAKTAIKPTVDIALVGAVNETAKTFEVKFTFAKATVNAATQTADAVPDELMAGQITIQKQDPNDAEEMVASEAYVERDSIITLRSGVFVATVNYRFDPLPLYVGTSVDVSATTIGGMALAADADPVLGVAAPDAPNNAPVFTATGPLSITGMVGTAITTADASATDADGDTLTYSWDVTDEAALGLMLDTATGMIAGTPMKAHTMDHIVTVMDGNGGSATLTVSVAITAATNGGNGGNGGAPGMPTAQTDQIIIQAPTSSSAPINVGARFSNPMIPAYGFAVLVRDMEASGIYAPIQGTWLLSSNTSLPDLAWFFGGDGGPNTGTIILNGTGVQNKDLIISEIMWGRDSSLADSSKSQWIEFYNATPNPIDLSNFTITFHRSQAFPSHAGAIDVVSNVGHVYFGNSQFPGSSGRSNTVDSFNRFAQPVNIVSMHRVLNHVRIKQQNVGNRGERNKGIGGWAASAYEAANIAPFHVATPGHEQITRARLGNSSPRQHVIINEIGNSNNDAHDWIELYNTGGAINIKNWELTRVTARSGGGGEEKFIARLATGDLTIPANSYVVITKTNPRNQGNDLAAGIDLAKGDADQLNRGLGSKPDSKVAYYLVDSELTLPNDNNRCLYILRHAHDREGQPTHIEDVVGTLGLTLRGPSTSSWTWYSANDRRVWDTAMWPLQGRGGPHGDVVHDAGPEHFGAGRVYQRNGKNSGTGEHHLSVRGYTGIGYDRIAANNSENGGTPGYANGALVGDKSDWADQVSFSEIMLVTHTDTADGRVPRASRLPQWLEIYNSSLTQGVNINNWYLEIQNADTEDLDTRDLHGTLRLPNMTIPPNQTILITTSAGLNSGHFPELRLINLFLNGTYRNILTIQARGDSVLSQVGFYVELRDHKGNHVDEIGNLAVRHSDPRRGVEVRDQGNFSTTWDIPDMITVDGHRTSLIRIYDDGKPRDGLMGVGGPKNTDTSWILASDTNFRRVPNLTYYGNHQDYGTPGYRGGGPPTCWLVNVPSATA